MAEFYVVYSDGGKRMIGIVDAPIVAPQLKFPDYGALCREMDSLGCMWTLRAAIEDPRESVAGDDQLWLEQLAKVAMLEPEKKLPRDLLPQGIPPAQ